MSVRKRIWTDKQGIKHESWEYCITIQKNPRVQKRQSGFAKKGDAVAEYDRIKEELKRGRGVTDANLLFEGCKSIYMKKKFAKNTRDKYETFFKLHILPYFGKRIISEITAIEVDNWIEKLLKNNVGIPTINDCIKICKAQSTYLIKKKVIYNNPFEYTDKVSGITKKKVCRCFTIRQATRMLRRARRIFPRKFFMLLYLALYTGMREGELLGLDIKYIDFKNFTIEVAQQYTAGELKEVLKTSSSYGFVEIEPEVAEELKSYITENNITSGLLFTNEKGNPINKNNMMQRWFKPLLKSLKFDKTMRFHDLRHTYASINLSSGVHYLYVSKQLRHSKPSVTLDIYGHFIPDARKQQEVKMIGQKFREQIVNIDEYRALKKRVETLSI